MPIIEASTFEIVFDYLKEGALLVLDLDNTLIESVYQYGSFQWGNHLVRSALQKGSPMDQALDEVMPLWEYAQQLIEIKPIESSIFQWLNQVNELRTSTIALTGRSPQIAPITLEQLQKHGFCFSNWSHIEKRFQEVKIENVYLEKGVLFVGPRNNKGKVLKQFLHWQEKSFSQIIFLDDQISYLKQVEEIASELNLPYVGIRYSGADQNVQNFDLEIAKQQQELLLRKLEP